MNRSPESRTAETLTEREETGTGSREETGTGSREETGTGSREETGTGSEVLRRACPPFLASFLAPWDWTRVVLERVPSTSDLARELVLNHEAPLPLVVWTREQTKGRGRGAHSWWSDEGSLTFTVALDPQAHSLRPEHTACVALASAVAIVDVLEPLLSAGMRLGIRWPNDVEADGRKLGGILPELVETPHGQRLLVGIGLNVRTQLDQAPVAVRQMATSVAELRAPGAEAITPEALLPRLLDRLAAALESLAAGEPALAARWRQLDTLLGRPVRIDLGGKFVAGTALGLDDRGGLRLRAKTEHEPVTLYGGQVLRDS